MKFRKATINDIKYIIDIYKDGVRSLKNDGVDQWQNPKDIPTTKDLFEMLEEIYVLCDKIPISTARIMSYDNQYDKIYNGRWLSTDKYYAIHKVATIDSHKNKGLTSLMFAEIENLAVKNNIKSIKIDTHHDNKKMRKFLFKNNFKYCGKIKLTTGEMRDAFELILSGE